MEENEILIELTLIQKWLMDEFKIFVSVSFGFESYQPDKPMYFAEVKSLSSKNMGEKLLHGFLLYDKAWFSLLDGVYETLKIIPNE